MAKTHSEQCSKQLQEALNVREKYINKTKKTDSFNIIPLNISIINNYY